MIFERYYMTESRDSKIEKLWAELEDIPMDPYIECIEAPFTHFPVSTPREDI